METQKINLDITWKNPTPEQNAAFELATKRKVRGLTEFQVAEFICLSKNSLWYMQVKSWANEPPKGTPPAWKDACEIILSIVDKEYSQENGWWYIGDWAKEKEQYALKMLKLADFGFMLEQYRARSMAVVSSGFGPFLDIVLGLNWQKKFGKLFKEMSAKKVK